MPNLATPVFDSAYEVNWKKQWPAFDERPATILEFIDDGYLGIKDRIRKAIQEELVEIFGEEVSGDKLAQYQLGILTGGIGIGKQQPVFTPVLTPKGWLPIGSLMPGDFVIGSNGKPTRVLGVFPQGRRVNYRLTATDGTSTLAGAEHLWTVWDYRKKARGGVSEVLSTSELRVAGLRDTRGQRRWQLPVLSAPVEYESGAPVPIPPYVLGALLGDGGLTSGVKFSTSDAMILARLRSELPSEIHFKQINVYDWRLVTQRGRANPLLSELRRLGCCVHSEMKSVPHEYLMATPHERLELLRGLMDTDGFAASFNHVSFTSASAQLAVDVVALVRSLGGIATSPVFKRNDCRGAWSTTIKMNVCPFWLERKASRWSPRSMNPIVRSIDSIEVDEEYESVCIKVEAADQLYVTEDFLLTHNTTIASVILSYMTHYVLCIHDPCEYFNFIPGSRIAFMEMSTSEKQALEVIFGDIKARVNNSRWFSKWPYDTKFTKQLRFGAGHDNKDIWILPGDSHETTFEGYNILGGVLDEADSHIVTETKDYAEIGYDTIRNRIDSRFGASGFLLVIGQSKKGDGFALRKYEEFRKRDDAYAKRMTIWDSFGDDHYRCKLVGPHKLDQTTPDGQTCGQVHKFPYDVKRKQIITPALAQIMAGSETVIWIPEVYRREFETAPEKALKDLAGIPPRVGSPFVGLPHKIEEAIDRWVARLYPESVGDDVHGRDYAGLSPIDPDGVLNRAFKATDSLLRVGHIDIAYSDEGDALGFAMGHVRGAVEIDGEVKPYIIIDLAFRVKAPPGGEVYLGAVRQLIYALKNDHKFKIQFVSTDGFQGVDMRQQLTKRKIATDECSVDKDLVPYYDLRDALYEDRIELPPYIVKFEPSDSEECLILVKEIGELIDAGKKIDHPTLRGSKDVSDSVAAVVFKLMGDRTFHRKVVSFEQARQQKQAAAGGGFSHPAYLGDPGYRAPVVPSDWRT